MLASTEVSPGRALVVPYNFAPGTLITVRVLAEEPVNTYLVDTDGHAEWLAGNPKFQSWGGFRGRRDQVFTTRLPPRNRWYLIIDNPGRDLPVHVRYEATIEPSVPSGGATGMTGSYYSG